MSIKKLSLAIAATALIPAAGMAAGLHGNNVTGTFGLISDSDLDSGYTVGASADYFVTDQIYVTGGYEYQGTEFTQYSTDIEGTQNSFSLGGGYEYPIQSGLAAFGEAEFTLGSGKWEGGSNEAAYDLTRYTTNAGVRGVNAGVNWEAFAGFRSAEAEFDEASIDSDSSSALTFGGSGYYGVTDDISVGAEFATFDGTSDILGGVRYSF